MQKMIIRLLWIKKGETGKKQQVSRLKNNTEKQF